MRTFRLSMALAAALSMALSAGGLFLASAPAGAGTQWKVADSGESTGQYSLAIASAWITSPSEFEVTATKASLVQWSVFWMKGSKTTETWGKRTFAGAGTVPVMVLKSSANCQLAANAVSYGTGTFRLSVSYSGGALLK